MKSFIPAYHSNLANVLLHRRKFTAARNACQAALGCDAYFVEAHTTLGSVLTQLEEHDQAILAHRRAILCRPDHAAAYANLGRTLNDRGRYADAAQILRHGLSLDPSNTVLLTNYGNSFQFLERYAEALGAYDLAVQNKPDLVEGHSNRGNALRGLGELTPAERCYVIALSLDPSFADAYSNLGIVRRDLGFYRPAIDACERAIQIKPDYAEAHYNLSMLLLVTGQIDRGYREYQWRWRLGVFPFLPRDFTQPVWSGESLEGKTILVHAEQGMGDCLQFARYLDRLAGRAGRVIFEVPKAMTSLLAHLPGVDLILAKGQAPPPYDVHCALMSLPLLLRMTEAEIPAPTLLPPPAADRIQRWRKVIPEVPLTVGIAWQGRPRYQADRTRSAPLAAFTGLARIEGVRLVSLQTGFGSEQMVNLADDLALVDLGPEFDAGPQAFLDCAAVMTLLDLVISVDTAIGHLAGSLQRPVWLALATDPHWPWLLQGQTTVWYPTMRLFRQHRPGDWNSVFEPMAQALSAACNGDRTSLTGPPSRAVR